MTSRFSKILQQYSDWVVAVLVIFIVGIMIVPLPTALVDLLLSFNMALAVLLLMVSLYVGNAMQIASFPSILLITTLFRLGLNVSTTRLILRDADAGEIVLAFGNFVAAGNIVVGVVVFAILTLIQFIVIAKGSERVAEVAARFSLDALPGKQMAIDADVRSGYLDQETARQQRTVLEQESKLYGSMDGAMKFVKGDAIAGILITIINIIGGLTIGMVSQGMDLTEASRLYTVLTIGDGLVSQIPALLISLAAGLVVTRVSIGEEHVGHDIVTQLFVHPKAMIATTVFLLVLAFVPGLPLVPFLVLGLGACFLSFKLVKQQNQIQQDNVDTKASSVGIPPIVIEFDTTLQQAFHAHEKTDVFFRETLNQIRENLYQTCGINVPSMYVRPLDHTEFFSNDDSLAEGKFVLYFFEQIVMVGSLSTTQCLVNVSAKTLVSKGVDATQASHPVLGNEISSINTNQRVQCERLGFLVYSPLDVFVMILGDKIKTHASEFVGIEETKQLIGQLEQTHPTLVNEVVPQLVSLSLLSDILRKLVQEDVSIRDLRLIIQALADAISDKDQKKDPVVLTEQIRIALRRQITLKYAINGILDVWMLDPLLEDTIRESLHKTEKGVFLALDPQMSQDILKAFRQALEQHASAVIVTSLDIRHYVRRLIEIELPLIAVLSFSELLPDIQLNPQGKISVD